MVVEGRGRGIGEKERKGEKGEERRGEEGRGCGGLLLYGGAGWLGFLDWKKAKREPRKAKEVKVR